MVGSRDHPGTLLELTHAWRDTTKRAALSCRSWRHQTSQKRSDPGGGVLVRKLELRLRPFVPLLVPLPAPGQCPSHPDVPSGSMERAAAAGEWGTQPPQRRAQEGPGTMPAVDPPRAGTDPGVLLSSCPAPALSSHSPRRGDNTVDAQGGSLGLGHLLSVGSGLWRGHHVPLPSETQSPG